MNQVVAAHQPTKLERFQMEILPPDRKGELFSGLPSHIKPERFERNLANALMQNPGLMELDPRLVFREVSKAAALGLYLDPQLGEAYLIAAWNGKAKRKEPQLRIGYRGLIKLGRQSGEISMIYAHEVHANDVLDVDQGAEKKLIHKPDLFGDRGLLVGYYAVVKYKDGDFDFEPLTIEQAHTIRNRSDGWRAYSEGKIKSTPWATDEVEMSKKTAIRRLTKRIPQSPELAEAIRIEDQAEHGSLGHAAPTAALEPPKPPTPPAPPQSESNAVLEPQQGDIVDAEVVEAGEPETATQADAPAEQTAFDANAFLDQVEKALERAETPEAVAEAWDELDVEATLTGDPDTLGIAIGLRKARLGVLR